eukprot:CAMPEP_0119003526 /NCGR_PEP_ID=MMETSP1176-20130426/614_1 /TAXON_ID=265551 /ORGANISM="Synedropsis recta cf, Strain CCMP1620" /LENGTH=189 /DNA_ID=CAMNT_0006955137 /DNA_START=116 /DNA_END=685 /DNA_ORIENTATION=+
MSMMMIKSAAVAGIGAFCESKYGPSVFRSPDGLFAATPLILIGLGFFTLSHGLDVGRARSKYMELAKKDGEKEVDERYGLPNLYAQGTSKHALAFNCVQRSHQHIFENYSSVCVMGCMASLSFPIMAAISTFTYAVGRITMSKAYAAADGDASKRYSSKFAIFMWYGFLMNMCLGAASCIKIIMTAELA